MELVDFIDPLRQLHDWIRGLVVDACQQQSTAELSRVVHDGAGDVTYSIDRVSETALLDWFTREIAAHEPIVLIGEGLADGRMTLPAGACERDARWQIIVDPIDGTRGLMYQKRPAWILTGVAPNSHSPAGAGATTSPSPRWGGVSGGVEQAASLADIRLAIQTEIPLIKQHLSDQIWAVCGQGVRGLRHNRLTSETQSLAIQPSTATDLRHGFATVCRFFPGGRDVLAALDDALGERLFARQPGDASVFEDQYACTGGQLYGLASGTDRFVADLRPLVQPLVAQRGIAAGHCCHPYDLCTKLIAEETGIIITGPTGGPLEAPLDTETDVAWVGYANEHLQELIEPVMQELLREHRLIV